MSSLVEIFIPKSQIKQSGLSKQKIKQEWWRIPMKWNPAWKKTNAKWNQEVLSLVLYFSPKWKNGVGLEFWASIHPSILKSEGRGKWQNKRTNVKDSDLAGYWSLRTTGYTSDYIVIRVGNDPIKSPALNKIFTFPHSTNFYNNAWNTRTNSTHLHNPTLVSFFSHPKIRGHTASFILLCFTEIQALFVHFFVITKRASFLLVELVEFWG